ncbi:MAG: FtsQ-type POTRA domain-containing protein [Intestinibacter sp.]|uniref:cell division protein FtsQ/DivIB n=1 Tax=Intestinibacter sp. TaxID=1965304 RepID=UPI0025C64450|nr:FtsQ-type POTRA domain-containing protein [Intestinibacter sp.]MCI6738692.1 FtsQ-type POTRA domain-containing protein [Intestinibacter sp.]
MKKKKNKRRKIRINRLITLLLFVFMICFGIIVFIKSDFFSLKYVKIVNNNILTKSDISQLSKITVGKNIFTYDLKKIKSNIEENSYVENISIKRKLPNSLIINVKEKDIMCALKDKNENYYYIDKNMKYVDKIDEDDIKDRYPIVGMDFSYHNKQINYKNKSDKKYLNLLMKNIKTQGLDKKVKAVDFFDDNQIDIDIDKNIKVVILKDKNIDYNMYKLTKILLDLEKQNIHYGKIDMTFSKYTLYTYQ